MTQVDETHIYGVLDHWICKISDGFGRSLEDLVVMIQNHSHTCFNIIQVGRGQVGYTICIVVHIKAKTISRVCTERVSE